jgi:hypothetical protein
MLNRPPRIDFIKDCVVYTSVVDGNAYQSVHKKGTLTNAKASKAFYREHADQVYSMVQEQYKKQLHG